MAHPLEPPIANKRGQALCEFIPVLLVLFALVAGALLASYLIFARTILNYRAETALLCLHQGESEKECESQFRSHVSQRLPWGQIRELSTQRNSRAAKVFTVWELRRFQIKFHRSLAFDRPALKKVLRW